MSNLLNTPLTMSSREIAELTGKQHKNVVRDVEKMATDCNLTGSNLSRLAGTYTDAKGERRKCYNLPKNLTITLIAGYRADLRLKIVDRWLELETEAAHTRTTTPARKRRPAVLSTFNTGYKIALNLGYDKNQAVIYGDRYCRNKCGESPVEMMGMTSLAAPDNDNYLTPTELGEKLGGLSGRRVNQMLAEAGLQTSTPGSATGSNWTMTEAGKAYGRMFDTTRKHGTGSQQQLKWKPSVLDILSGKGEAA
ncbi:Rha family transcriptional regulator [Bombella apis]|uniref:Rha family transcriptional regulator n=1 Tax=Bombella apis TaxID=1785988 RepID=A0ABR9MMT1_9PROT|nr:Rha family transcriptional regulator [Bombella apis]MBE1723170.1 Rha family transcriptional regulator [Bombella apis]MBR9730977.1 Rha family transcriptional regulator [Bombella apis]